MNTTSFTGNADTTNGWSTVENATTVDNNVVFAGSDFIVGSGKRLRLNLVDADVSFGGRSLTLANGGELQLKKGADGGNRNITFSALSIDSLGTITMGQDKSQFTLKGAISLAADSTFRMAFGTASSSGDYRPLAIDSTLTGDATTAIDIIGSGDAANTSGLTLNNVGGFYGTITSTADSPTFTLAINGAFGGTITALPASTTAVKIDFDGLPSATGLRVASTTIPAALKTKLVLHSPTADFFEPGLKIMTFPEGTAVEASEFSVSFARSAGGATKPLYLESVSNADGTVSLAVKAGRTFYKIGSDASGTSSFTTNVSATVGWATAPDATATTPFSSVEMLASDFVIPAGRMLRTPETTATAWTFGGKSLCLEGEGSGMLIKSANNAIITVDNLVVAGGEIGNGVGNNTYTVAGKITIEANSTLGFGASEDNATRTIVLTAPVHGDDTTAIVISDSGRMGTGNFHFGDLGNFFGSLRDIASNMSGGGTKIYIDGAFSGSVGALTSKASLFANYDVLPAEKGLVVSTNEISASHKTKLTLYSATTDFMQDRLPLVTFPAGTDVDPTAFTVKHATSATGTATAFPHLTVVTNADDTVTLVVDATVPMYAKMVKGEGDAYAWHFYGCDWGDVTATCGLSVPDASITVYVTDTAEVAPILANPGTPAGYRIETLAVSADADLAALSPLTVSSGFMIDLNGHALTVPGSVLNALKTSTKNLVNNGTFEANTISDGTYNTSVAITGWTKSNSSKIGLMRKNTANLYAQRNDATTWCYISNGYNITQTITVPEETTCLISLKVANRNVYNSSTKKITYYASNGKLEIDGTSVLTWSGGSSGTRTLTGGKNNLTAGNHTLKISCTSNSGFGIDNVTLNYQPSTATIKSSVAGGELHVYVPANAVVTNSAVNISGHVKFVKEGAGTFVSCRRGLYYDGGNEIVEGKLTTAEGSGSNRDWSATYRVFGQINKAMTVRKNGTLDIAGNYEYGNYNIVLDGGLIRSGKLIDTGPINQATNTSWAGIGRLSLTTNSTFYLRSDTLFSGWDDVPIKLNGHELLFNMAVDSKSVWLTKDMTNGTIRLSPANSGKRRFAIFKRNVDARTVDVIDEAGCISPFTTFSVRSYTATAPSGNEFWSGTGRMYVYGTFTPTTDYFYGCTMMDGSTIDLSGRSGTWSTTGAYNCGRRTVDFADGATINVKVGERNGRKKLVSWTSTPSNLAGLTFKCVDMNVTLKKEDDGLYLPIGFVFLVR